MAGYSRWLPLVAGLVSARNGATFGLRDVSQDRNNQQFSEALGSVQSCTDPRDSTRPSGLLPNTYQYYWQNENGVIVGTNDGTINPNVGSTRAGERCRARAVATCYCRDLRAYLHPMRLRCRALTRHGRMTFWNVYPLPTALFSMQTGTTPE